MQRRAFLRLVAATVGLTRLNTASIGQSELVYRPLAPPLGHWLPVTDEMLEDVHYFDVLTLRLLKGLN